MLPANNAIVQIAEFEINFINRFRKTERVIVYNFYEFCFFVSYVSNDGFGFHNDPKITYVILHFSGENAGYPHVKMPICKNARIRFFDLFPV